MKVAKRLVYAVLGAAAVMVLAASGTSACTNSPDDGDAVAYFSTVDFSEGFSLVLAPTSGGQYTAKLTCDEGGVQPPEDLQIALSQPGATEITTCNSSSPITVDPSGEYCSPDGQCVFQVLASNSQTESTYSDSKIIELLSPGTDSLNLSPATLPICDSTVTAGSGDDATSKGSPWLKMDPSDTGENGDTTYSDGVYYSALLNSIKT